MGIKVVLLSYLFSLIVFAACLSFAHAAYPKAKIFAGGGFGEGELATLGFVYGAPAFDSKGDMYVAVPDLHRILKISNGVIKVFAGNGVFGLSGDGGLAINAQLNKPNALAFGSNDDLYIADTDNSRIRKIDTNGTITTITGSYAGFIGDGGLASSARVKYPVWVDVTLTGEIYVADTGNHRIRKIDINGTISTIAGTGQAGYDSDGILATSAKLNYPNGVMATSTGIVYIADKNNHRIRKIDTNGIITTIAGTGISGFSGDGGLATDAQLLSPKSVRVVPSGEIYICDTDNNRIRIIYTNGTISTIAGTGTKGFSGDGGLATNAQLSGPSALFRTSNTELYFWDNDRIRKIDSNGIITTVAGVGKYYGNGVKATSAQLLRARGCKVGPNGEFYIADTNNHLIRKIDTNGILTIIAGTGKSGFSGDGGLATNAQLNEPYAVAVSPNGEVYIADATNHRIRVIYTNGTISTIAGTGTSGFSGDGGLARNAQLNSPRGIAMSSDGEIVISDTSNQRIRKIDTNGTISTIAGTGLSVFNGDGGLATKANIYFPYGVAVSPNGEIYFAGYYAHRIRKIYTNGTITTIAGTGSGGFSGDGGLATNAQVNEPYGVAVSPNGEVYIADSANHRARKIDTNGFISTVAGSSKGNNDVEDPFSLKMSTPFDVAISYGNIYITDSDNSIVRVILTEPIYCYGIVGSDAKACNGNGVCKTTDTCVCNSNYFGATCLPRCFGYSEDNTTQVCNNNGKCIAPDNCQCNNGWNGSDCGTPVCFGKVPNDLNVCSGHGQCISNDTCRCEDGFLGNQCEMFTCFGLLSTQSSVCNFRNGTCISNNTCVCENGWTGLNCSTPICYGIESFNSLVCSSHGQCVSNNTCVCEGGWTGLNCSTPICYGIESSNPLVCSSHGKCISNNTCQCENGWTGLNCSNPICYGIERSSPLVCSSHGQCISNNTCVCEAGWKGLDCAIPICYGIESSSPLVCSSHGQCISNNTCQCENGWTGLNCSTPTCYGIESFNSLVCSSHGQCVSNNTCVCEGGWTGLNCSNPVCYGKEGSSSFVCSSHGQCISNNTCRCENGWTGLNCSTPICYGMEASNSVVCSSNGQCISNNTCQCENGWTGLNCSVPICYGIETSNSLVCSSHGQCISNNTCQCENGWTGLNCSTPICYGIENFNSLVCSSHGQCVSNNTCQCFNGWKGLNCSTPTCFGIERLNSLVCSSHGQCISNNTCVCENGWSGLTCSTPVCYGIEASNSIVCSSHGQCISNNTCSCENGWNGSDCSNPLCFGIESFNPLVCSLHGQCISNNTCQCENGWTGLNCSIPSCFGIERLNSLVCSSHGQCISNNTCQCFNGWIGDECGVAECFGELSNSSSVCSSHGTCIAPNKCECKEGWGGLNCSQPYCFNVIGSNHTVCSSHGECISNNTCQCQYGWYGNDCSVMSCFGEYNNTLVCSGHGTCQDVDTCTCESKWKGLKCSVHTCNGVEYNNSNVCSGHGSCVSIDKCICESGWNGNYCSLHSCNEIAENGANVCSGHGTCSSMNKCDCQNGYEGSWCEFYYCKGKLVNISTICEEAQICSSLLNCSGNGECNNIGKCQCYSNSSKGYWKNETCNECQENYYGRQCLTSFKGPAMYLDDYSGIYFTLYGNLKKDQNIDCSFILKSSEMYLFGSKPTCNWVYTSSEFYIKFGEGYELTQNMLIHLNMLVFDSIIESETFISTTVHLPLNPVKPTALISQTRNEYGSCEEIVIDGSGSFSPDKKPLVYIWTISQISNYSLITNSSFITLPESATSGDYSISLKVVSSLSGLESQMYQVSFKKQQVSFPVVSIIGGNYVSKIVTVVPSVIGTVISLPSCISNSSTSLSYKWEKIIGPELTIISNSKDLIITEFKEKTPQAYTFKLTVTSIENTEMIVSTLVYLNTTREPFNSILYISELTTDKAIIGAEFSIDLDISLEIFKWTCQETNSKAPCENSINNALEQFSLTKSTLISIPKSTQNISLTLQVRDVFSTIDIIFPTSTKVSPLINLLMMNPPDRIIMRSNDILNLQLSVSINGVEEGIDSILERMWTLNGKSIPISYVSSMKTSLSDSNYIILDISNLEKGADYTLQFQATNLESGLSSSYLLKFSVAKAIPKCIPTSSVTSYYALETKLALSLPNCKLDSTMEANFYILDEISGAKIYLASGSQITTLLPLSDKGYLTILAVITEKTTGETSDSSITIASLVPIAKSLKEIKAKQKSWTTQASLLLPGDPQLNVLNSGTISYVSQRMMSNIGARRTLSTCRNGTLNSQTQECTCKEGYAKLDCSITKEEWIERKELMDSLALLFSNSYYSRNKYEKISDSYLLSQIFSMRNILRAFDDLSSESVDGILNILGEISMNSVNNKNLASPSGLEDLLLEVVNILYRYNHLVLKETLSSTKMNYLTNITLEMSNFIVRNKYIGGDSLNFNADLIKITSNRIYPRDLSEYLLVQSNSTNIKLPYGMMKYVESSYSKRKPLTLRLTTTNNFNNLVSSDTTIISNMVTFEVLEFPLSNITERIDFGVEMIPPLSSRDSSLNSRDSKTTVCSMFLNGVWDSSKCLTSIKNNTNMVDCLCTQQGSISILSQIHKAEQSDISPVVSPTTSNYNPTPTPTSSSKLELLALLSLIILLVIVCGVITLATCCIIRKKRERSKKPKATSKELVTV